MDRCVKTRFMFCTLCFLFLAFSTIPSFPALSLHVYAQSGGQSDTTAPTSTLSILGDWNGNYYNSYAEVSISATDSQSQGVKYTAYRINSGTWIHYTEPFMINTEGSYIISYYSEDYAGNPEQVKTAQFEINSHTPTATPAPTQIVFVTSTPSPTSASRATPTGIPFVSPSVIPTDASTSINQAYPASFPYYRSPTKTPTPSPAKIKTVAINWPTTSPVVSPTPSDQLVAAAATTTHEEPQNILGQWTKVNKEQPESANPMIILILAFTTLGTYVFVVFFYYSKIKNNLR